ncbi:hypothetical protein GS436_23855, partial [Rhodococcus hoagii]|nr:hypothetical protein [Prescottella equi]
MCEDLGAPAVVESAAPVEQSRVVVDEVGGGGLGVPPVVRRTAWWSRELVSAHDVSTISGPPYS